MRRRTSIFLVAAALFAVWFPGCDPGYDYRPIDQKGVALQRWTQAINGVNFATEPYYTLIGSSGTSHCLEVTNNSDDEVIVEGGELEANGRIIPAMVSDDPEHRELRTISPKTTKPVV